MREIAVPNLGYARNGKRVVTEIRKGSEILGGAEGQEEGIMVRTQLSRVEG